VFLQCLLPAAAAVAVKLAETRPGERERKERRRRPLIYF
jgi:hypothetical protein